jgi:hypothetical protein
MNLLDLFIALASYTTPHGTEAYCIPYLPETHYMDDFGNIHVWVPKPDGTDSETLFSSHLDTADRKMTRVDFKWDEEKRMLGTGGKTILGADDKIGVALMVKMIEAGVPGWYIFHVGEEVGLRGSSAALRSFPDILQTMKRCVAFDRKGYTSVITVQCGDRTCSDEFANALASQLLPGFVPDPTGVFTDSYTYRYVIPECTNVSVGYFDQHHNTEVQDIGFAEKLLEKLLLVDWENLPTNRDPAAAKTEDEQVQSMKYKFRAGNYTPRVHDYDFMDEPEWKNHTDQPKLVDWDKGVEDTVAQAESMSVGPDNWYQCQCPRCGEIQWCDPDDVYQSCDTCYEDLTDEPPIVEVPTT